MNEIPLTVVGTVVRDIHFNTTKSGTEFASFRLACNNRRWNRSTNAWEDGDTTFLTVVCWRTLAQNVLASVHRGEPVVVTGRLKVREWSNEERSGISVELEASAVGHDLARGKSDFKRPQRAAETTAESGPVTNLETAALAAGVNPRLLDAELVGQNAEPEVGAA